MVTSIVQALAELLLSHKIQLEVIMKNETVEKVMDLFEVDMIYLNRSISVEDLACITGEEAGRMRREFEMNFGYSFDEMVTIWRLCHARDLLKKKVPYTLIWKLSGFKSRKEMEREWDRLVY